MFNTTADLADDLKRTSSANQPKIEVSQSQPKTSLVLIFLFIVDFSLNMLNSIVTRIKRSPKKN